MMMFDDDPGRKSYDLLKILLLVSLARLALDVHVIFFR